MTPRTKFNHECRMAGWSPSMLIDAMSPAPPAVGVSLNPTAEVVSDVKLFNLEIYDSGEKPRSKYVAAGEGVSPIDAYSDIPMTDLTNQFENQCRSGDSPKSNFLNNKINGHDVASLRAGKSDILQHLTTACSNIASNMESYRNIAKTIIETPFPNGWELFKHQKEAIWKCLELNRIILAYDMGLGKTLIGLKYAEVMCHLHKLCALVVIAPCTLIENWKREGEIVGFVHIDLKDLAVVSPKRTEALHRIQSSSNCLITASWAKIPTAGEILASTGFENFVIVADEAHAMQTMTSVRTKSALALCKHRACRGVVLATGTPMKNGRPVNLYPLLVAIRHPISFDKIEYEKRYCNAKKTAFCAWDTSGVSNLSELKAKVGQSLMRKTKVSD